MAPRRGGAGGAGVDAVVPSGSGRAYFEPPPLKRVFPWLQDGSGQCDLIAGGVDESGIFKGVYVTDVQLVTLLRTFQLSKAFLPVDLPTPVASLGQSLRDGIPLVIVTRGVFGRELDYGTGPLRNKGQKAVWDLCREMRAEMPQVLITCIDVPVNLGTDVMQGILEPPLNEYRELMYQDGTWYTPSVYNAASLGKWLSDNQTVTNKKTQGPAFQRKRFDWVDNNRSFGHMYIVGWKAVLEVRPAPEVPRRTDLNFLEDKPKPEAQLIKSTGPSAAESTFKKASSKAREAGDARGLVASVLAYLPRAAPLEKEGLREAIKVAEEAAELHRAKGENAAAFGAQRLGVGVRLSLNEAEEALKVAQQLVASAQDAKLEVEALRLVVSCHSEVGELDKALEAAKAGKDSVAKRGDPEALTEAWGIVVTAQLAKGEVQDAVASATTAAQASDKKGQARALLLLASTQQAKAAHDELPSAAREAFAEAAAAQSKALQLFQELGLKRGQVDSLHALILLKITLDQNQEALASAKALQAVAQGDFPPRDTLTEAEREKGDKVTQEEAKSWEAAGLQLAAVAHLSEFAKSRAFFQGGEDEAVTSGRASVAIYDGLGESASKAAAQRVLGDAVIVVRTRDGHVAQRAVDGFKLAGAEHRQGP